MMVLNFRYEVCHNVAAGCEDFIGIFQDADNIHRLVKDAIEHKKTLVFREYNARSNAIYKDESYAILHKKPNNRGYCFRVERSGYHTFCTPWEDELTRVVTQAIGMYHE